MIAQTITEFAGFLNDAEYSISSDKVAQCIASFSDDLDCTSLDDMVAVTRLFFCRNREERASLPDYFQQFLKHREMVRNAGKSEEQLKHTKEELQEQKRSHDQKDEEFVNRIRSLETEVREIKERVKQEWEPDPTAFSKKELEFLSSKKKWIKSLGLPDVEDILSGKNMTEEDSKNAQMKVLKKSEEAMKKGDLSRMEDFEKLFKALQKVKKAKKQEAPKKEKAIREATADTLNKIEFLKNERKREQYEHQKRQNALEKRINELKKSRLIVKPDVVKHRPEFVAAKNAVRCSIQCPPEAEKEFKRLTEKDKATIYRYIKDNIIKFKTRMTHNIMDLSTGRVDMGATIKNACRTGGLPMDIFRELKRPGKSNLILVLDVSGSCREASEMMLTFMYILQEVFPRGCRAYAFVNELYDITEVMHTQNVEQAIKETLAIVPRGYSNYGKPISAMWENKAKITKDSFVIFIGDARNNSNKSSEKEFRNIARRAKKTYWMNTDEIAKWGEGDSIAPTYAKYCKMFEVRTPKAIVQFLDQGVK